jgi:D-alanyl-D-alanine dipeptidase
MEPARQAAHALGLVDVREFIPGIVVDQRYRKAQNTTGRAVYPPEMPCLLRVETARKLAVAQAKLQAQGYQLAVWDAWRPPEAHLELIEQAKHPHLFRDPQREGWSGHCIGCAVDVTLLDQSGRYCRMPTDFDEQGEHTGYHYQGGEREIRFHLHRLQTAMHEAGFLILPSEWWHFDDDDPAVRPLPVVTAAQLGLGPDRWSSTAPNLPVPNPARPQQPR